MAINPNREQARLNKTLESLTKSEDKIRDLIMRRDVLIKPLQDLDDKIAALETARNEARQRLNHNSYPDESNKTLDENQVAAANESIERLTVERNTEYESIKERLQALMSQIEDEKLTRAELCINRDNQTLALERQTSNYPVALKRHLARARRNGFDDARLKAKK